MTGDRDPRATLGQVRAVYENLAGTKRLVTFADLGHEPYLPSVPGQWRKSVAKFVDQTLEAVKN